MNLSFVPLGNAAGGPLEVIAVWVFLAVVGFVALPFVAGPLLIKYTQKTRRSPTLIAFDPDDRPAPPVVREFLDEVEAALWGCGFEALGHVAMPDLVPNVKAIFTTFGRPESNDLAIAVAAFGETGGLTMMRKYYVEFATDYADGFGLCTNNSADESAYCPLPHKKLLQFDRVRGAADLWRVHERATKEFGTGSKKPIPPRRPPSTASAPACSRRTPTRSPSAGSGSTSSTTSSARPGRAPA